MKISTPRKLPPIRYLETSAIVLAVVIIDKEIISPLVGMPTATQLTADAASYSNYT